MTHTESDQPVFEYRGRAIPRPASTGEGVELLLGSQTFCIIQLSTPLADADYIVHLVLHRREDHHHA